MTLLRKSPLHPGKPPRRYARLRNRSPKRAREQRGWNAITAGKIAAGMGCEPLVAGVCNGRDLRGHHKLPKGRGGKSTRDNHALTCPPCHDFLHQHETDPRSRGWILRTEAIHA